MALSTVLSPQRLLDVRRAHWGIKNHQHWPLDVVFGEDAARTRKDHGPENLAIIRRIALSMLHAHPSKRSISRKMNMARLSNTFLFELFTHMQ